MKRLSEGPLVEPFRVGPQDDARAEDATLYDGWLPSSDDDETGENLGRVRIEGVLRQFIRLCLEGRRRRKRVSSALRGPETIAPRAGGEGGCISGK